MDACFGIRYQIGKDSSLEIKYNDLNPLLSLKETQVKGKIDWIPNFSENGEKICAKNLGKVSGKKFNINIEAKINNAEHGSAVFQLVNLKDAKIEEKITFEKRDSNILADYPYLTHWKNNINASFSSISQWPIRFPEKYWIFGDEDVITFKGELLSRI